MFELPQALTEPPLISSRRRDRFCVDPGKRKCFGVQNAAMTACACDHDRYLIGDLIEIEPVRHAVHVGKVILIPAPAGEPSAFAQRVFRKMTHERIEHVPEAPCVVLQLSGKQHLTEIKKVHVGIVETRADESTVKICQSVPGLFDVKYFRVGSSCDEAPVLDRKRGN